MLKRTRRKGVDEDLEKGGPVLPGESFFYTSMVIVRHSIWRPSPGDSGASAGLALSSTCFKCDNIFAHHT